MFSEKEKLNELIRLGTEINTIQDFDLLLERILFEARKFTNADAGSIYIREGESLIFKHVQNDTQQKKLPAGQKLLYSFFKVAINNDSIAGHVALTGKALNIPDVYNISKSAPYIFHHEYDEITEYKTQSMLTLPLQNTQGRIVGVLQIINSKGEDGTLKSFDEDDEVFVQHFANSASIVIQRAQNTRALILRMIEMARLRDPKETGAHVNRVASYSVELYERWAMKRNIPRKTIDFNRDILRIAAMLHDVGKVGISDLILKKPARLTEEEFEIMKGHSYIGAALFKEQESEFDVASSVVALTHHENWDGTGYPGKYDISTGKLLGNKKTAKLKGEAIPIFGRIVALADVYDALSSKRVYKEAWDEEAVLKEIKDMSGKKFDPELVDIFLDSMNLMRSIADRYPDTE